MRAKSNRNECGVGQWVRRGKYKLGGYGTSAFLILAVPYDQVEGLSLMELYDFLELRRIKVVGQRVALEAHDEIKERFNVGLGGGRRRSYTQNVQGL